MAWTKVKEQGQFAKSGKTLEDATATRVFIAVSDSDVTTIDAETADDGTTAIPALLATYGGRYAISINASPADEEADPKRVFKVEVGFSSKLPKNPNPLERDADISWDFDDATETYFVDETPDDEDGPFATVNSASERFQELFERETGSLTVTITKNIGPTSYAAETANTLKDALNDASIVVDGVTLLSGQAKCKGWTCGGKQEENGVQFRVSKVVLQLRPSWDDVVEDRGFHELASGKLKEIVKGTPPTKPDNPWPLDGAGAAKANADDEPAELTFQPYAREPFDGLPLV